MLKPIRLISTNFVLLGSLFILTISQQSVAQNTNKAKYPYQKNPFREGEILGPDSSTDPLPVELVEDPALGVNSTKGKPKFSPAPKATGTNNSPTDKELLRDLAAKISDKETGTQNPDNEATTTLNAKDVEIATLVKSFSKIAKRNYVVDSNVKGKVTIHLAEGVSTGEALRILDSVLLLKGFTSVPIGPNTYKIIQAKDAKKTTIPTIEEIGVDGKITNVDTNSDALVTQLIRLKNVQASDLQATMQQFISGDGLITTFQGTNSLIVIDSAANIERVVKVVKQLDVPALDQDVTVIPVKYAQAKDIAEKISQILGQGEDKSQAAGGAKPNLRLPPPTNIQNAALSGLPPQPISPPSGSIETGGSGRRSLPAKVLADERTNSIVVVADQDTTKKVQALVEQLDSKVDLSGGKFYVVRLKHADAEDLSDVLNAVLGGGGGTGGSRKNNSTSGSSLNRRQNNSSNSQSGGGFGGSNGGFGSSGGGRGRFGGGNSGGGGGGGSQGNSGNAGGFTVPAGKEGSKVNFEGDVSIASDPTTNSIIISSSKNDYLKVKEVIDILDVRRKQVLVETTLLEVSLDKNKELGFDLVGSLATDKAGVIAQNNTGGGLAGLLSNPAGLSNLTIAAASSGSITLPGGVTIPSQALVLRAVETNENVNVLSTPTILTTDNQEAEIVVGNNIPIVTSQATNATNLGNTFNNIERQDVGITLRLTPQIGAGDFVTMKIFVEISDVLLATVSNANGPSTSVRTSETNVEVKSGQMVITGGLIQDRQEEGESGIPYLSDIPVLGNLFSTNKNRRKRTNLLIFITPRILEDQFDVREATVQRRDVMDNEISREIFENKAETDDRKDVLHSENIDKVFEKGATTEKKPTTITPPKILSPEEENSIRTSIKEFTKSNPPKDKDSKEQPTPFLVSVSPKDKAVTSLGKLDRKAPLIAETSSSSFAVVLRSLDSSAELLGLEIPGNPNGTSGSFFQTGSKVKRVVDGKTREFLCLGRHENVTAAMKSPLHPATWQKLSLEESLKLGSGEWTK